MRAFPLLVCLSILLSGCVVCSDHSSTGKEKTAGRKFGRDSERSGIGCWNDPNMRLIEDSPAMAHEVGNFVPPGMPIGEAQEVMERHGFMCNRETFDGVDYLVCVQRRFVNLGLHGQWTIHIYPRNGVVANVQCAYDLAPTFDGRATIGWLQRHSEAKEKRRLEAEARAAANGEECEYEGETTEEPAISASAKSGSLHL